MAGNLNSRALVLPSLGSRIARTFIDFSLPAWNTVAAHRVFAVTGLVRLLTLYFVRVNCVGGVGALISFGHTGLPTSQWTAAALATLVAGYYPDLNGGAGGLSFRNKTYDQVLMNRFFDFITSGVLAPGWGYELTINPGVSGQVEAIAVWTPLSSDGLVVPATGGAL